MTNAPTNQKNPPKSAASPLDPAGQWWQKCVVLGGVFAISAFHLLNALKGHSWFRDIHLGAALEYAKGRIDLFRPIIVGFNLNNVPTPQELPVWQAAAGAVFKCFGTWFG